MSTGVPASLGQHRRTSRAVTPRRGERSRSRPSVLATRLALEELLSRLALRFASGSSADLDDTIHLALQELAEFVGVERSSVYQFSDARTTFTETHEWCAPGIPSRLADHVDVPLSAFSWLAGKILADEPVIINTLDDYPPEAAAERQACTVAGNLALAFVPMAVQDRVVGCIGLHAMRAERHWSDGEVQVCRTFGALVATALARRRAETERAQLDRRMSERTAELIRANTALKAEIAERQAVETALRQSEEKFRSLVENASDGVCLLVKDRLVYANETLASMLEYPLEQSIGIPLDQLVPNRSAGFDLILKHHRRRTAGESVPRQYEARLSTRTGKTIDVVIAANRVQVGTEFGSIAIIKDVTEQKRAEQALRMYAKRLEIMRDIDRSILELRSREMIAASVLRHIRALIPCVRASVWVAEAESPDFVLVAVDTDRPTQVVPGTRSPAPNVADIHAEMLRTGGWFTPELRQYAGRSPMLSQLCTEGIVALMSVALAFRGKLIGTLTVGWDQTPEIAPGTLDMLKEIGDQVAVALKNAQLFQAVNAQGRQLRELTQQMTAMQEHERRRIAQELHDQVGPALTALGLTLSMARKLCTTRPPEAQLRIDDALTQVEQATDQIRTVMTDLRPPVLDDYGLIPALRWYCQRFAERTGLTISIKGKTQPRLPADRELSLFRVVQEALNNIARHAKATTATVEVTYPEGAVEIVIQDNGCGFDLPASRSRTDLPHGWGLISMRERVEAFGGALQVTSEAGRGTRVSARIPR